MCDEQIFCFNCKCNFLYFLFYSAMQYFLSFRDKISVKSTLTKRHLNARWTINLKAFVARAKIGATSNINARTPWPMGNRRLQLYLSACTCICVCLSWCFCASLHDTEQRSIAIRFIIIKPITGYYTTCIIIKYARNVFAYTKLNSTVWYFFIIIIFVTVNRKTISERAFVGSIRIGRK